MNFMPYPIKLTFKSEILPAVLVVAAWVLAAYFYGRFPAEVVSHWNFAGQPDRYTGRAEAALALPVLLTFVYGLFLALPSFDPKSDRYQEFGGVYHFFKAVIITLLFGVYVAAGFYNLGYNVSIGKVVPALIGLAFIAMGNYMGKIKSNWFMGVRTPWTLSSENVWVKTNRFGGVAMVLFGLFIMLAPFLPAPWGVVLFFAGAAIVTFGSLLYSFIVYRKERQRLSPR